VAQEALANVRKHAHTERVRVALGRRDGSVWLEVRDWGRGFTPAEIKQGAGPGERVGLSSMRERIALLGGSLEVLSEPGNGTSVVAEVPLQGTTGERVEDGK
jgi:signal transduction histidine kinase